jgi:hypothetical protein
MRAQKTGVVRAVTLTNSFWQSRQKLASRLARLNEQRALVASGQEPSGAAIKAEIQTGMPWQGNVRYTLNQENLTAMRLSRVVPRDEGNQQWRQLQRQNPAQHLSRNQPPQDPRRFRNAYL